MLDNKLIEDTFANKDNYKIVYTEAENNNAIVFFSSHAVYLNEEGSFEELIVKNDRYEWENIAKNKLLQNEYKLMIFVRDLKKETYRFGINSELNSYDKVIDKIGELTKGYNVTTCGNSAGGYMAQLCGIKLKAKRIFTFSGYFKLPYGDYPLLKPYITGEVPMFYFVPFYSEGDVKQYNESKGCKGVYTFLFDSKEHGQPITSNCYPLLLSFSNEKIIKLYKKNKDKIINKDSFYNSIIPFYGKIFTFLKLIFSVRREYYEKEKIKIITLFGIKIKLKKKINRN